MGLRRGEILALRWCDIDLEKSQVLQVRHSLERVKGEGLRLSEPKSKKAIRELRIPQICLASLIAHKSAQEKKRSWVGSKWQDGGFVFATGVGTPIHPDDLSRELSIAWGLAKLPKVRFHDLRH